MAVASRAEGPSASTPEEDAVQRNERSHTPRRRTFSTVAAASGDLATPALSPPVGGVARAARCRSTPLPQNGRRARITRLRKGTRPLLKPWLALTAVGAVRRAVVPRRDSRYKRRRGPHPPRRGDAWYRRDRAAEVRRAKRRLANKVGTTGSRSPRARPHPVVIAGPTRAGLPSPSPTATDRRAMSAAPKEVLRVRVGTPSPRGNGFPQPGVDVTSPGRAVTRAREERRGRAPPSPPAIAELLAASSDGPRSVGVPRVFPRGGTLTRSPATAYSCARPAPAASASPTCSTVGRAQRCPPSSPRAVRPVERSDPA